MIMLFPKDYIKKGKSTFLNRTVLSVLSQGVDNVIFLFSFSSDKSLELFSVSSLTCWSCRLWGVRGQHTLTWHGFMGLSWCFILFLKSHINCKVRAILFLLMPVTFFWAPHPKQCFSKQFWTVCWSPISLASTSASYALLSHSAFSTSLSSHRVYLALFTPRCPQAPTLGWARDGILHCGSCSCGVLTGWPGCMCWFAC